MHPQRDGAQLAMKDVSKAYGDRSVLDQVTLTVRPGEKTAVIGENGSGKSTLLRLLSGAEAPDTGEITVRFPGSTGYLAQTLDLDPADTVQDAVDAALAELRGLEDLARTEELVEAAGARLAATGGDPKQGFGKHRRSSEAKLSGRVRAARTRLDALRRSPVPPPPRPLAFTGRPSVATETGGTNGTNGTAGGPASRARTLVELDSIGVGDRLHLSSLRVASGARLLVTGENGAGKTTLLRVLAGDLNPDTGTVIRHARIGYLPQELPARPTGRTLLATFAAGRPGFPDEYADGLLALGLFRPGDLDVPVASLSVGQQRRLALARLVTRPADLLVLDEPTNHIALSLVEELEQALDQYRGAVVVVSHDRSFRARFTGDVLELRAGRQVGEAPAYASGEAAAPRTRARSRSTNTR
ncbi:ATP-binding cassette domain-containing protein [Streptomyces rubiginosohelvolus]|uniref:ATP-binding cassette domain-containing protein n=1 Tax=Streptomyces rubiginosohelvolus TaxID=67362 RepID=UPI0033A26B8A